MTQKTFFKKEFTREYTEDGERYRITATAEIHSLSKQHPYFGLTCWKMRQAKNGHWMEDGGGADHDEIAKRFPKLKKYIPFHLVSTDEPMHYIANSLYWAGLSGWTDGKKDSPPNLQYLKDTCLWTGPDLILRLLISYRGGKKNIVNRIKAAILTKVLESRLASTQRRFIDAMAELFGEEVRTLPQTWQSQV